MLLSLCFTQVYGQLLSFVNVTELGVWKTTSLLRAEKCSSFIRQTAKLAGDN
jgi:hypothetical protein